MSDLKFVHKSCGNEVERFEIIGEDPARICTICRGVVTDEEIAEFEAQKTASVEGE